MVNELKNEKKKVSNQTIIIVLIFFISFAISFGNKLISNKSYKENSVDNGLVTTEMTYIDFLQELENSNVEKAILSIKSESFVFYLKGDECPYITSNPGNEDFKEKLLLNGVLVDDTSYSSGKNENLEPGVLITDIVMSLLTSVFLSIMLGVAFSIVKPSNIFEKKSIEKVKKVFFSDIIGLDEITNELQLIVSLMKNNGHDSNIRIPKGILLEGPPGNGKTMLAQAIATEADINFLAINASDLADVYFGGTGKAVRKLFEKAKNNAPCVVFIDEIEAIGSTRFQDPHDSMDKEMNGVINTLLTKLDGISDGSGVVVIAATNRASSLDSALIRPGRFDKQFYIPNPDTNVRKALFAHYLNDNKQVKYNYENLASKTQGYSCAEIENIVNEAKIIVLKEQNEVLDESCIIRAIKQYRLKGLSKDNVNLSEKDKETISIHEAGHAIVGYYFSNKRVNEISICPTTSGVGGYTQIESKGNEDVIYSEDVFGDIVMLLGGKAAESVMSGRVTKVSLGSDEDINVATKLAIGYVKFKCGIDYCQFGNSGTAELMKESKKVLDEAYEQAIQTVTMFKEKLILITFELMKTENLTGEQFLTLVD